MPFGKARIVRSGTDITVVATSYLAYEAVHAADELAKSGISVEVVDPPGLRAKFPRWRRNKLSNISRLQCGGLRCPIALPPSR